LSKVIFLFDLLFEFEFGFLLFISEVVNIAVPRSISRGVLGDTVGSTGMTTLPIYFVLELCCSDASKDG